MTKYTVLTTPGSSPLLLSFSASNDTDAQTTAQSFATLLGQKLWLKNISAATNLGSFDPGSQGSTVASASGVTLSP